MNLTQELLLLIAVATTGLLAILTALIRQRRMLQAPANSPYAASTEGGKRCHKCGMRSLWIARNCIGCGARLPG